MNKQKSNWGWFWISYYSTLPPAASSCGFLEDSATPCDFPASLAGKEGWKERSQSEAQGSQLPNSVKNGSVSNWRSCCASGLEPEPLCTAATGPFWHRFATFRSKCELWHHVPSNFETKKPKISWNSVVRTISFGDFVVFQYLGKPFCLNLSCWFPCRGFSFSDGFNLSVARAMSSRPSSPDADDIVEHLGLMKSVNLWVHPVFTPCCHDFSMSHPRSPRQSVTIEPGRLWKGEEMMPMLLRQQHTEAQAGLGEQGLRWCGAWGNQQPYIYIFIYIHTEFQSTATRK